MSRWTDIATWIGPTENEYPGGMSTVQWVILHIQDGTEAGTEAWQRNPGAKVSSHFLAPRAGGLRQMVDTADAAWAEVGGNRHGISIECEGRGGQPLTDGQVEACAQVVARAHRVYGIPLQACDDPLLPGSAGLTGHGKGGAAWGGHLDCPGDPVLAVRGRIIERAAAIVSGAPAPIPSTPAPAPTDDEDDMTAYTGVVAEGYDQTTLICPPPANIGPNWGNVWISFAATADVHLEVDAYIHGRGWVPVAASLAVPADGDRVNPFGGPAPAGIQKLTVKRVRPADAAADDPGSTPVAWLVEAVKK